MVPRRSLRYATMQYTHVKWEHKIILHDFISLLYLYRLSLLWNISIHIFFPTSTIKKKLTKELNTFYQACNNNNSLI